MSSQVYFGERPCEAIFGSGRKKGMKCTGNAYYVENGCYLCGVHSHKDKRQRLPKDPKADEIKAQILEQKRLLIEEEANKNKKLGRKGSITVSKLRMMKMPEDIDGYLKVFPNFKHQNRKDGFGCSRLSPKSLGPVNHGMPNLPVAQTIENYHQFAKIFEFELKNEDTINEAFQLRKRAYETKVPYRHKYPPKVLKMSGLKNVNIPLYSVYYTKTGEERRYSYIQCRYFYCHWYERLAKEENDFKELQRLRNEGYNLQIIGYDGYKPTDDLYRHYLDESRPFGHELVLYTLLVIENRDDYPWNRYYRENREIYDDVIGN